MRLRLGRGDVFFRHFPIGPRTAHVEKLEFETSNHLHFGIKAPAPKYTLMAVIVFALLIVVTPVGIEFAVMRMAPEG